jgi:DNA-binding SARP family transcriptional activator
MALPARRSEVDSSPVKSLELVLLGGFQVRAPGRGIDGLGRKERALLAFLAMPPGEPRSREKLAALLWSDLSDKQARDSLKQALLRLRKSFGSLHLLPVVTDRASVTLDRADIGVDVQEFEQLVAEGTPDGLARATKLYRGDLLEGLDVRDPAFEEWLLFERQRLRDQARDALASLLDHHMASAARDIAARRLLALDPLHEAAHRAADLRSAGPDGAGAKAVLSVLRRAATRAWCPARSRDPAALPGHPGEAKGKANRHRGTAGRNCC